MRFPPVMSRAQIEKSGYLKSFPEPARLRLRPAWHRARHQRRGQPLRGRRRLDHVAVAGRPRAVARRLLSGLPDRGEPRPAAQGRPALRCRRRLLPPRTLAPSRPAAIVPHARICLHRQPPTTSPPSASAGWRARRRSHATSGLPSSVDQASDPFFGRVGQIKAVSQKQQALKFELLVPLRSEEQPTACMSFNYHREHFGTTWGITDAAGDPAHTGCVAFGMDRLAVAMFHTHGTDLDALAIGGAGDSRPARARSGRSGRRLAITRASMPATPSSA